MKGEVMPCSPTWQVKWCFTHPQTWQVKWCFTHPKPDRWSDASPTPKPDRWSDTPPPTPQKNETKNLTDEVTADLSWGAYCTPASAASPCPCPIDRCRTALSAPRPSAVASATPPPPPLAPPPSAASPPAARTGTVWAGAAAHRGPALPWPGRSAAPCAPCPAAAGTAWHPHVLADAGTHSGPAPGSRTCRAPCRNSAPGSADPFPWTWSAWQSQPKWLEKHSFQTCLPCFVLTAKS